MHNPSVTRDTPLADTGTLLIVALLLVDSLHFVFARILLPVVPPMASAFYVLSIGAVEVGLFGLLNRRVHLSTFMQQRWFFLSIGLLVAVSTILNYASVTFIDPGTAALLNKTSLIFGLGIGVIWLKERLSKVQIGGALLSVVGAGVVTFQPGEYTSSGATMVLASALMYALHAAVTKRYGGAIEFIDFFFFRLLSISGFLLLFVVGSRSLVWPNTHAWGLLLLAGTVDVVISRTLYYIVLRRLSVSMLSIVLTLGPVAAATWSLLLFSIWPTPQQLLGGAAVLLGVAVVALAPAISAQRKDVI